MTEWQFYMVLANIYLATIMNIKPRFFMAAAYLLLAIFSFIER